MEPVRSADPANATRSVPGVPVAPESDLADRVVRQVETATSFVRDKAVKPLRRIAAFLGLGLALILLGGAAVVFLALGAFRLLQQVPPGWPAEPYLLLGVPLVLLGIVAWLRRKPRSDGRGGDKS